MTSTPTIAFIGTGRGLPMAMNLARAGLVHADDDLAAVYTGARTS